MLTKGKASKVLIAAARREPVAHIGEGSDTEKVSVTRLLTEQSLTAPPVESRHFSGGCEAAAALPPGLKAGFLAEELMNPTEKNANAARMACAHIGPSPFPTGRDCRTDAVRMKTDWRRVIRAAIAQILNRRPA